MTKPEMDGRGIVEDGVQRDIGTSASSTRGLNKRHRAPLQEIALAAYGYAYLSLVAPDASGILSINVLSSINVIYIRCGFTMAETTRIVFDQFPDIFALVVGMLTSAAAVLIAYRGLGTIRAGGNADNKEALERIKAEIAGARVGDPIPFEIEQLANYYSVTLGQAKVSFWFSLIFASVGFIVILGAAFLYKEGDILGASIKIMSGLVIDAVAALFFVQSRRAQEAMGAFFEKLRTDRQFIEARKICDEINNDVVKDNIRTILVLHYSGLQTTGMLDVLAGVKPISHASSSNGQGRDAPITPRGTARKPKPEPLLPSDGASGYPQS